MAAEAGASLSQNVSGLITRTVGGLQTTPAPGNSSSFGFLGWAILAVLRVIPIVLYWVLTFTTITLPTWLFTLMSMSLTVTMNFTTL